MTDIDPMTVPPVAINYGDWLFTCRMEAVQFHQWDKDDGAWYDFFTTLDGSSHSYCNCSLKPVSESYALWFNSNEMHTYLGRIQEAKIRIGEAWVSDDRGLWFRQSSDVGVQYLYERVYGLRRWKFLGLRIDDYDWWYTKQVETAFRVDNMVWAWIIYEDIIKQRAIADGIEYEGY